MINEIFEQHTWNKNNKEVVLIGNPREFLIQSLSQHFQEKRFKVHVCEPIVTQLNQLPDSVKLYLFIINDTSDMILSVFTYLHDKSIEEHICVCPVCQRADLPTIGQVFHLDELATVYQRPVNARAIVDDIDSIYEVQVLPQERHSILVIDDDPEYLRSVKQILKNHYKVYLATSAASAIMILAQHVVELILLDYQMPVLNGPKTLEVLRSEPHIAQIPVMFLTGMQDPEAVRDAILMKPVNYVLKTTAANELTSILSDFFTEKKYRTEL